MKHSFYARNMNLRSRRLAREIFETLFRMKKLLLFWSMILGFGTALSAQTSVAKGHIGLYTKDIGKIKVTVVTDGHLPVKPVQAEFAQRVDSVKVAETLKNGFSSPREVDLAMNVLLLEHGEKLILIDAGAGTVFGDGCGHLAENLSYAGISPEEITDVVLTHAHPDHIGGLTGSNGKPMYPNAEVWLSDIEYDFWTASAPDFSKSTMTDTAHMRMLVEVAQRNIEAAGNRLRLFHDGDTLLGCLQMVIAPGHTPGHSIIRIFSDNEELYHIADVVHSEILSFEHPEWIYNSDTDYSVAIETRKEVLGRMADAKTLFFAYHLPWPGLGYATREGKAFEWHPQRVSMPY